MPSIIDISEVLLDLGLHDDATDAERAVAGTALVRAQNDVRRYLRYDPMLLERTEFYPQMDLVPQGGEGVWDIGGSGDTEQVFMWPGRSTAADELQVRHLPIRSIAHLFIDYDARSGARAGSFAAASEVTEGTEFWPNYDAVDDDGNSMCGDGIIRSYGRWPSTPGCVKIIYTAGYSPDEMRGRKNMVDASSIVGVAVDEAVRRAKKVFIQMKKSVGWVAGPMQSERLGDYSYTLGAGVLDSLFGSTTDLLSESKQRLDEYVNWGVNLAS